MPEHVRGRYTQSDYNKQRTEPVRCECRWDAYWRHLANVNEPSMCGNDAASCQFTLTTCLYCTFFYIASTQASGGALDCVGSYSK